MTLQTGFFSIHYLCLEKNKKNSLKKKSIETNTILGEKEKERKRYRGRVLNIIYEDINKLISDIRYYLKKT